MRSIYISVILALCFTLMARESSQLSQKLDKNKLASKNVIDFQNPAQKVAIVKVTNPDGALKKQNRKMGSVLTSGPAESLEKKENAQTELTNEELQRHLKSKKMQRITSREMR